MPHLGPYFFACLLLASLFSCRTNSSLLIDGRYDDVIINLSKRASKGKLSYNQLAVFQQSLQADLLSEVKVLNTLLASDKFEDWKSGYIHIDDIEDKHSRLYRYPQVSADTMLLVDVSYWDEAFKNKLYAYHMSVYSKLYENFQTTKDKKFVIDAYYELKKADHFAPEAWSSDSLLSVFLQKGSRKYDVQFLDLTYDNEWGLEVLKSKVSLRNQLWSDFSEERPHDYTVYIKLNHVKRNHRCTDQDRRYTSREVNGYKSRTSSNGEVVQDRIYVDYAAVVNERMHDFSVEANVVVEVVSNIDNETIAHERFAADFLHTKNEASLVSGEMKAVPETLLVVEKGEFTTKNQYDYQRIEQEVLRNIGRQVKHYLESL